MKFVLVAGDYTQSEVLKMLGNKLLEEGHTITAFLRKGRREQLFIDDMPNKIQSADWVVTGMSNLSLEEMAAVRIAHENKKPIALYADTWGCHRMPAFEEVRSYAKILLVVHPDEAADARAIFPATTNIVMTGNPRWEEFAFPTVTREKVRKSIPIEHGKYCILVAGSPYIATNMFMFPAVIEAVNSLSREDIEICFFLHPQDSPNSHIYADLQQYGGRCKVHGIGLDITTPDLVIGCDLVVQFSSTIGIQASYLRIPVIDFFTTIALRGKPLIYGSPVMKLVDMGVSRGIYHGSVLDLATAIETLLTPEGYSVMKKCQEDAFPIPTESERGAALRRMIACLTAP